MQYVDYIPLNALKDAAVRSKSDYLVLGPIGSEYRTVMLYRTKSGGHLVKAGCFTGTLDQLERNIDSYNVPEAWSKEYRYKDEYREFIRFARAWLAMRDWSAAPEFHDGQLVRAVGKQDTPEVREGDEGVYEKGGRSCASFLASKGGNYWVAGGDLEAIPPKDWREGDTLLRVSNSEGFAECGLSCQIGDTLTFREMSTDKTLITMTGKGATLADFVLAKRAAKEEGLPFDTLVRTPEGKVGYVVEDYSEHNDVFNKPRNKGGSVLGRYKKSELKVLPSYTVVAYGNTGYEVNDFDGDHVQSFKSKERAEVMAELMNEEYYDV